LIRDTYPDPVAYQAVVMTAPTAMANAIYRRRQQRGDWEEVFMALTRSWRFDQLPLCHRGVAWAMVHFTWLAFTFLAIYLAHRDSEQRPWSPPPLPLPKRELAVYGGPYFALLRPGELLTIILENHEGWVRNQDRLLEALRLAERMVRPP
jgi:hypothetical protein